MAYNAKPQQRFVGGIADSLKEGANGQIPNQFYFARSLDYRTDPQALTLLPGAIKESGSVVTDLLKFADISPTTLTSYFIGNTGNFYSRTTTPTWTNIATVPSSHGNGLAYFSGDDYVYMTGDSNISRYGPTNNSPSFTANFLTAQGGVPTNTASVVLASASSQYADAVDSASLSITGDLTLETYFYANSLPTVGNSMTLLGKWDESSTTRSYLLSITAVSGYFGNGSDGALTISSNTTEAPIDSACTGTSGTQTLTATNASFASGQVILIHQTQGTNAGYWERNTIQGYTAGTITTGTPLKTTYTTGAQVRVLKQYTNVTIDNGFTYTAKAWNGTVGGILSFLASGTITVTGSISASSCGFRGGTGTTSTGTAQAGEGTTGAATAQTSANGNGGGGSSDPTNGDGKFAGGGGGSNGTAGESGFYNYSSSGFSTAGSAGSTTGSADLTTMVLGGGGGGIAAAGATGGSGTGGNGGGILFLTGVTITVSGGMVSNGSQGGDLSDGGQSIGNGGSGAGGSILLKAQTATLGSGLIVASGGSRGTATNGTAYGGAGGSGRVHLDYLTSYTGTTTPTLDVAQDSTLVTTTTYQARLGLSDDGTATEYLYQNLNTLTTGTWNRLSVAWDASASMATFYLNGTSIGTATGSMTSISDNASSLYVGANMGASSVGNFFDGYLNDMRIWSNLQSASQIANNLNIQVSVSSAGLEAYYKFNSALTDATANANDLTGHATPTYTTSVPFANATTRLDIDTENTSTGNTYTLPTSISETAVNTLNFTPVNDPQASVGFYVDTQGTGNWTVTVHNEQNVVVAQATIANASIPTSGFVEFIYSTPWRIQSGQTYHMHVTVSTGTSKLVSGTLNDLRTAEYATYFAFLVTDTLFHPVIQFQFQPLGGTLTGAMIIGNERYLAVWDGTTYYPNFLAFTPGWRVRCFAFWRQYLAIGVWKGGNIYDLSQGRIYFWSGYQPAYDFFIDIPEGQINALFGIDTDLYIFAGSVGNLLDYRGGDFTTTGNSPSNKLKKMPLLERSAYTEVYPGALNMWRGLLHMGLYANSSSTTSQRGVYSYGTLNQFYPESLSYDYPISTGNRGSTVSIGLVYPVGQNLLIGWQDGISYGVDVINFDNAPAPNGEIQLLLDDGGAVWHDDSNVAVKATYLPLATGESITPEINLERVGFTNMSTDSVVGSQFTSQQISGGRVNEIQIGAILTQTNGTSPTLLGLALAQDELNEEGQF